MWAESCNISDSEYLTQEFKLPNKLKEDISWQSRAELLSCWLETLIQTPSDFLESRIIDELGSGLLLWLNDSDMSLTSIDITDAEFWLANTIEKVVTTMTPSEKMFLSQHSLETVIIWGIAFNYSRHIDVWDMQQVQLDYFKWLYNIFNSYDSSYFSNISNDERIYLEWVLWTTDISDISSYQVIFEELWITNKIESSLRPVRRPQIIERVSEYRDAVEAEQWINQFDILNTLWFKPETQAFIIDDFLPRFMWVDFEVRQVHIDRLQDFMLFLIDMETTAWTDLVNGVSTATSYTQTLNESKWNRSLGRYNSIDTRLRTAVMFYNWGNITRWSRNNVLNVPENQGAEWIWDLWYHNTWWKNMNEFTFDSEMRLTMMFLYSENPSAMMNIIHWNNSKYAAIDLYDAHHTNTTWHTETNQRLSRYINKQEHYW